MGMKVCKLVRLTNKDAEGNFNNKGEGKITLRKRVVVEESSVAETEGNYKQTGLLYIVDETATKERDKAVDAEVEAVRNPVKAETVAPTDGGTTKADL